MVTRTRKNPPPVKPPGYGTLTIWLVSVGKLASGTTTIYIPRMSSSETRFAMLLFSDIVGSTDLKARHGVPAYREALVTHNGHFERIAGECHGIRILQNVGDGYFAEAGGVAEAVKFALLFQDAMRSGPWGEVVLTARVGIHAGEVSAIETQGGCGLVGPAADLAARVMSLALGGQILLSRFPFDEARHFLREHPAVPGREAPGLVWLAHGPYLMKGRDEPMEIFEVGADGLAPLVPPPDSEKVRRAIRPGEEETLGWRPAVGLEVPGRTGWMLTRKIGEGGFGEVWLAEQAAMKQRRVFKFCFDEERLRSFKRELTFFRLIRDALGERTDIARLYDVKLDAPPFFLESEFAEHGNLVEWSERQGGIGAVPMERRLEIVACVAEAVSAAHSVGILHKDLKPQNVLMQARADGGAEPQLTDFGIGALADKSALAAHEITAAGFTVNTLVSKGSGSSMTRLYAPPEQLTGKPYTVQGDVYALGVILYQMVTGDFTRALAPGWEREVKDELLREDLAECLDGDPARRMASAAELAERLRSLDARRAARETQHRRRQANARRKRNTRLALIGGAIASVIAIVLGAGFLRERTLRKRATDAEQLAKARLHQAQEARDAAEKLVNEAVFGLRDKLVLLGKINVLEDLAAAAEDYYAKLPPELVSDATRRQEVFLALNRGIIATASSDDEAAEAACNKALTLARELSAKSPGDEGLRAAQSDALSALASLRFGQDRRDEMAVYGGQLAAFSDEWLRLNPKSPGALRAKLIAISIRLFSEMDAAGKQAAALAAFAEAQGVAAELKQLGGETMETRVIEAAGIFARGMVMYKLGKADSAIAAFAEGDAAFKAALEKEHNHPFVHDVMLLARKWTVTRLGEYADKRGDEALKKEAYRQVKELVAEETALAEFEPARLERWKQLAGLYDASNGMVQRLDGEIARQAWLEKGLVAAERAASPKFDRNTVRRVRVYIRLNLADTLSINKPEGWFVRIGKLLDEVADIHLAPSKSGALIWNDGIIGRCYGQRRQLISALSEMPEQRAAFIAQAQAMAAFAQRTIETFPGITRVLRDAAAEVGKVAELLRQHGCPEAAELERLSKQWLAKLEEKFADDPDLIRSKAEAAKDRSQMLLDAWRRAPAAEKVARFAELEKHVAESLAYMQRHGSRLSEYDAARLSGAYFGNIGSAQFESGQFATAEAALRESVTRRNTAAAKAPNASEGAGRRTDAATAQRLLGQAILRQGRTDEGRRLIRESADTLTSLAKEMPSFRHWQSASRFCRSCSQAFDKPEEREERLAFLKTAVEAAREMLRLARAAGDVKPPDMAAFVEDASWCLLDYGWNLRDAHDLTASEAILREGLGLATENVAKTTPDKFPARAELRSHLRYDLSRTLFDARRTEDALHEIELLDTELKQVEQAAGAGDKHAGKMRQLLEELRHRLPK